MAYDSSNILGGILICPGLQKRMDCKLHASTVTTTNVSHSYVTDLQIETRVSCTLPIYSLAQFCVTVSEYVASFQRDASRMRVSKLRSRFPRPPLE